MWKRIALVFSALVVLVLLLGWGALRLSGSRSHFVGQVDLGLSLGGA
jgi:hypothetical protein